MAQLSIGFIGAGNIAEAIIRGLIASDKDYDIRAVDFNPGRIKYMVDKYGIIPATLQEAVEHSQVILVAVKPKDVAGLLSSLDPQGMEGKLLLTVAAGIPLTVYEKALPNTAVIRCMPNTSSAVLRSMTGLSKGRLVNEEQALIAEQIFSQIGKTAWFEEEQMNAVTAISGSGPAYYYYFTECLIEAGVKLGLEREQAELLAIETLIGAGKMIAETHKHPTELREAVTSPNGTTYAALCAFREAGLEQTVLSAAKAAKDRGHAMEGEFVKSV